MNTIYLAKLYASNGTVVFGADRNIDAAASLAALKIATGDTSSRFDKLAARV